MVAFRWINLSFLVIVMLHFTASTVGHNFTSLSARVGDDLTLPCGNDFESTVWIFDNGLGPVLLSERGHIHKDAASKSDRLSVTGNCSLVLKKITEEDAGYYTCRQFISGRQQGPPDYSIHLSVITITEQKNKDKVSLFCSVFGFGNCRHTVEWLYEGKEEISSDMKISELSCSATVTFTPSHLNHMSKIYELLKCKVTDFYTYNIQQFPFIPQSSGEETGEGVTTSTTQSTSSIKSTTRKLETPKSSTSGSSWWYIIVSVGLAALIISVVAVNIWTNTKGNKSRTEANTVHSDGDEDEVTVRYENVGEPSVSVRHH